ncbi:hypothetical protein ONE63_006634 [Megalurothrips usitatus]|uniref:Uncharacterized protein n=1 Tax=Megalurothrips usitatus TaxID=439358 RepID=A0AAV7XUM5_9NEOP|nr:hypothetical protein ONE63_006634 [Megalurothrips usitatus]
MGRSKSKDRPSQTNFFLADSKGFIICIDKVDLLVADPSTVKLADEVQFKYGAETLDGVVTFLAGTEAEALAEMKVQAKQKRPKPNVPESVVQSKRVRVVSKEPDVAPKSTAASIKPKQAKNAAKKVLKKKVDRAKSVLDDELSKSTSQAAQKEADIQSGDESEGSRDSSSASSSDSGVCPASKKLGKAGDVQALQEISSDADEVEPVNGSEPTEEPETFVSEVTGGSKAGNALEVAEDPKAGDLLVTQDSKSGLPEGTASTKRPLKDSKDSEAGPSGSKKSKKGKRSRSLKRNMSVYQEAGGKGYLYCKDSPDAEKIHPGYEVYTLKHLLEKALNTTKSASICCRMLLENVFTQDALQNASAFGFPPRGKGADGLKQSQVLPRLDPNGIDALIARALDHQKSFKTWRPKLSEGQLRDSISNKVCLAKKCKQASSSSSSSSSGSEPE